MADSDEDRQALARFAETRDPEIKDWLADRYRGLAFYHARRYTDRGVEREDLEQVAMVGLLNALDRFDPGREIELATFASRTIEGELKRHFRDRGWAVRVPRGLRDLSVTVRRATEELEHELGRSPQPVEIAERCGVDVDRVLEALDAASSFRAASLDAPDRNGETRQPAALASNEDGFAEVADEMVVRDLLGTLPERERTILEMRFYERLTQAEIGEQMGISQMHVSRLLRRSLLELRLRLEEPGPDADR